MITPLDLEIAKDVITNNLKERLSKLQIEIKEINNSKNIVSQEIEEIKQKLSKRKREIIHLLEENK